MSILHGKMTRLDLTAIFFMPLLLSLHSVVFLYFIPSSIFVARRICRRRQLTCVLMYSDEKANALEKFTSGNASVLVATNIIEVRIFIHVCIVWKW